MTWLIVRLIWTRLKVLFPKYVFGIWDFCENRLRMTTYVRKAATYQKSKDIWLKVLYTKDTRQEEQNGN